MMNMLDFGMDPQAVRTRVCVCVCVLGGCLSRGSDVVERLPAVEPDRNF